MRGFSPCTLCPKRFAWDPSFASILWTLTWVHKYCVRAPSPRRSLDNRAAQLIPTGFPKPTSRYRFGLSKWFGGECAYRSRERSLDRSGFPEFSDRPGHLAFHSSETAPRIRGAPRFVGVGRATHLFGGRLLGHLIVTMSNDNLLHNLGFDRDPFAKTNRRRGRTPGELLYRASFFQGSPR
jgi:hypothetical protein